MHHPVQHPAGDDEESGRDSEYDGDSEDDEKSERDSEYDEESESDKEGQ